MGLLDRALKRQCFPVKDEPDLFVKGWSFADLDRSEQLQAKPETKDKSNWYLLGCALVEQDNSPVFTRAESEEPAAFADRVKEALLKIGFDIVAFKRTFAAIEKVATVDTGDLKKSSPTTTTPDSPENLDSNSSADGTGGT